MAMCLGWKSPKNCGRTDQVTAPGCTCPDITWFWIATAATAALAFLTPNKEKKSQA